MNICVYCASSSRVDRSYFEATERLARELVRVKAHVIFGGGSSGLMGRLADTVLAEGGTIKGIIPRFMDDVEWAHRNLTEIEFTETMHERKAKMLQSSDALVALPGGTGTLEELFEAFTLKRLGQFSHPIVVLNTNGFYDPLIQMLEKCVQERFMNDKHLRIWSFVREPEEVLPAIHSTPAWGPNAIEFAVVE